MKLLHGALTYRDASLAGFDAAAVVEVIEHLDLDRLAAFERVLFGHARSRTAVLTTPTGSRTSALASRQGSSATATTASNGSGRSLRSGRRAWWRFGYSDRVLSIGPEDPEVGPPTRIALFGREA